MTSDAAGERINACLESLNLRPLDDEKAEKFSIYVSLILRWNERLNLTALRTEDCIISIHLAESIACATMVPQGINTLLEFGSGAGFPGLPIALCRPEIAVTLAESQGKKAAFLQEVIRTLSIPVTVHAGRAEDFRSKFDCVVLRAVDKMPRAVVAASKLVGRQGWLGLMTTLADVAELKLAAGSEYRWDSPAPLPGTERKIMTFGNKAP